MPSKVLSAGVKSQVDKKRNITPRHVRVNAADVADNSGAAVAGADDAGVAVLEESYTGEAVAG
nr:unnamed protein product [Callosobruchus chinensis]